VKAFNLQYNDLIRQLVQQGGTFPDSRVFVEEAYLDSPDEQFVRFIQHLQDQNRMNPPGRNTQQLMDLAEGKVNQMQVLAEHKATDPGKEPELLALKAKLDNLRKAVTKFKKNGYESSNSSAVGARVVVVPNRDAEARASRAIRTGSASRRNSREHPDVTIQASQGSSMV
jgi:hypothetical protein